MHWPSRVLPTVWPIWKRREKRDAKMCGGSPKSSRSRSRTTMDIVDSHCHLDSSDFAPELDQVLERARSAGVGQMVTIGVGGVHEGPALGGAHAAIALAERYAFIWATVGV